jgi:hypothetical protein
MAATAPVTTTFQAEEEGRPIRGLPTESVLFSGIISKSSIQQGFFPLLFRPEVSHMANLIWKGG